MEAHTQHPLALWAPSTRLSSPGNLWEPQAEGRVSGPPHSQPPRSSGKGSERGAPGLCEGKASLQDRLGQFAELWNRLLSWEPAGGRGALEAAVSRRGASRGRPCVTRAESKSGVGVPNPYHLGSRGSLGVSALSGDEVSESQKPLLCVCSQTAPENIRILQGQFHMQKAAQVTRVT